MSIELIQEAVRSFYARKDPSHDLSHAMRVRNNALYLAKQEGADAQTVELAALLHDIGREGTLAKSHAGSSANLAASILGKFSYPESIVAAVKHCVEVHSLELGEPETLEAKIVFDADKLDFCGAIGLARLFSSCGTQGVPIYDLPGVAGPSAEDIFHHKLAQFPAKLYTPTARQMLADHHEFALEFWRRMRQQITGPLVTDAAQR
ncbi:MAG: HD domain-containing protein [Peptococcaceae bacterium]|nr:HD domain-containing protein [Peptococcaceae bacterium]